MSPQALADLFPVFEALEGGATLVVSGSDARPEPVRPPLSRGGVWLGLWSSGSTGRPKLIWRSWPELRAGASQAAAVRGWTWASPYQPWSYAGVQVALQAWASGGRVISVGKDWSRVWGILAAQGVNALACTPTYSDFLIQSEPAGKGAAEGWALEQMTLGGEVLRPALGARLARRFPQTRFTVIYAAAEWGVLLKTHRLDGWYESQWLTLRHPQWRVADQTLEIKRGRGWISTGDEVEVRGELIRVAGRRDAVANVAGTKVSLTEIAELAEQVTGVRRAVAVAEPNPITGQIVCLQYALEPGADPVAVAEGLRAFLGQRLRKEAWPRRWELDEVGPAANAKRKVR